MKRQNKRTHRWLDERKTGGLLLVLGCLFVLGGICRGEQRTVEMKSNMICMECIGIG